MARSYATFGQRKPIVARREGKGGIVIAGNHQLAAARELGWEKIAVVWVDADDITAKAFALADNRTADLGTYDNSDLLAVLQAVHDADAELFASTAYDEDALAELIGSLHGVAQLGASFRSRARPLDRAPHDAGAGRGEARGPPTAPPKRLERARTGRPRSAPCPCLSVSVIADVPVEPRSLGASSEGCDRVRASPLLTAREPFGQQLNSAAQIPPDRA